MKNDIITKEQVCKKLHILIKSLNDDNGEPTANYSLEDYRKMFDAKSPVESHNLWMEARINQGWKYGTEKSIENKTSPCLVPYKDLPKEQLLKDFIAQAIIKFYNEFGEK